MTTLSDRLYAARQLLEGLREELQGILDDRAVMDRDGVEPRLTCARDDLLIAIDYLDTDAQHEAHVEQNGHGLPMPGDL